MVLMSVLNQALTTITNAERRGKRQVNHTVHAKHEFPTQSSFTLFADYDSISPRTPHYYIVSLRLKGS